PDERGRGCGGHRITDYVDAQLFRVVIVKSADEIRSETEAEDFGDEIQQGCRKGAHTDFDDGMGDADDRSDMDGASGRDDGKSGQRENRAGREKKQKCARGGEHGTDSRDVETAARIALTEPVRELPAD